MSRSSGASSRGVTTSAVTVTVPIRSVRKARTAARIRHQATRYSGWGCPRPLPERLYLADGSGALAVAVRDAQYAARGERVADEARPRRILPAPPDEMAQRGQLARGGGILGLHGGDELVQRGPRIGPERCPVEALQREGRGTTPSGAAYCALGWG